MTTLQFIAEIFEHASWPVSIVIVIIILKDPLLKVILNLKKIKVKDLEMDFSEITSIHKEIEKTASKKWEITSIKYLKPNMLSLSEKSPLAIVLQASDSLDDTITYYANKHSGKNFSNAGASLEWLEENDRVQKDMLSIYYRLYALKCKFSAFENEQLPKERAIEIADTMMLIANSVSEKNS